MTSASLPLAGYRVLVVEDEFIVAAMLFSVCVDLNISCSNAESSGFFSNINREESIFSI